MLSLFAKLLARPMPTFVLTRLGHETPHFQLSLGLSQHIPTLRRCTLQIAGRKALTFQSDPPHALVQLHSQAYLFSPQISWLTSIVENKFLGGLACWQHSNVLLY